MAIGVPISTNEPAPSAARINAGASNFAGPTRSPYRPASQRAPGAVAACSSRAVATRECLSAATASGRKVTLIPAATVTAAKTKVGISRPLRRTPPSTFTCCSSAETRAGRPTRVTSPASELNAARTNRASKPIRLVR